MVWGVSEGWRGLFPRGGGSGASSARCLPKRMMAYVVLAEGPGIRVRLSSFLCTAFSAPRAPAGRGARQQVAGRSLLLISGEARAAGATSQPGSRGRGLRRRAGGQDAGRRRPMPTPRRAKMAVLLGRAEMCFHQLAASCLSLTGLTAPAVAQDSFQACTLRRLLGPALADDLGRSEPDLKRGSWGA